MAARTRKRATAAVAAQSRATSPSCCIGGMCDPQRVQGLKAPARKGTYDLINLEGPGLFLAGQVSKQGGLTGLTFVRLQIDIEVDGAAVRFTPRLGVVGDGPGVAPIKVLHHQH